MSVELRPHTRNDDRRLAELLADPLVAATIAPAVMDRASDPHGHGRWRHRGDVRVLAIEQHGHYVGRAALEDIDGDAATARVCVVIADRSERGNGAGTQATKLLLEVARNLGLSTVWAAPKAGQIDSRTVLESLGFERDESPSRERDTEIFMLELKSFAAA